MISIELEQGNKESVEIYLDENGIDELINYLGYIKHNKDHFHLLVGNELSDDKKQFQNSLVKHCKLIYLES